MEFLTRFSAIFTFMTGAKSRVGFHTFFGDGPYRGDLMTHRLLYNPHLHTSQMFEAMVEALTRDPAMLPTFDFKPSAIQSFAKFQPVARLRLLRWMHCYNAKIRQWVRRHLSCLIQMRAICCH